MPLSPAHSEGLGSTTAPRRLARPRRPLLGLTVSFLAGCLLGAHVEGSVAPLLAGAWVALAAASLAAWRGWRGATPLLHATVAAAAWCHVALIVHNPSPAELGARWGRDGRHVRGVVEVADDPVALPGPDGLGRTWRFPARLVAAEEDRWRAVRGRLDVWMDTRDPALAPAYGERWLVEGAALPRPPRPAAGTEYRLRVDDGRARRIAGATRWSLRGVCLEGRRACARILAAGVEDFPESVGLVRALMLGYRHELPARAEDAFRRTGTLHIVAISGAHVGMVAMFFLVLLKATGCPQPRWILVLGPLLLLYALGTGMAASALRACIMAVTFWSAYLFRRQPDAPSALAFSALLILAVDPAQLWEAGFLLSFVVVGGLLALYPVIARPLQALAGRDPWRVQADGLLLACARWCARQAGSLVAVTLAAWLVSSPLIASYFNLVSPVALLANLAVVPMAFAILLAACLSVLVGGISPFLASVFNHANRVLVDALLRVVDFFHAWPGGHWFVPPPPAWVVGAGYVLLLTLFLGRPRRRIAAACVLVLGSVGAWAWQAADTRIRCTVAPIGETQVLFCDVPGEHDILVDTGPARLHRRLLRMLRAQGVDRIEVLILSRASTASGGGAAALAAALPVGEVWIPDTPGRSPAFAALVAEMERGGLRVRRVAMGEEGDGPGGVHWEVLHPARGDRYPTAGQAGLVLRLAHGAASVLFMGQGGHALEEALRQRPVDWGAGALVAGAVEDAQALGAEWLREVRPRAAVVPQATASPVDASDAMLARLEEAGAGAVALEQGWVARFDLAADDPAPAVRVSEGPDPAP